jgi:hypothetical protein
MEPIDLSGKVFCSNCGMTISTSEPKEEKVIPTITHLTTEVADDTSELLGSEATEPRVDINEEPMIPPSDRDEGFTTAPKPAPEPIININQTQPISSPIMQPRATPSGEATFTPPASKNITSPSTNDESSLVRQELIKMMGEPLQEKVETIPAPRPVQPEPPAINKVSGPEPVEVEQPAASKGPEPAEAEVPKEETVISLEPISIGSSAPQIPKEGPKPETELPIIQNITQPKPGIIAIPKSDKAVAPDIDEPSPGIVLPVSTNPVTYKPDELEFVDSKDKENVESSKIILPKEDPSNEFQDRIKQLDALDASGVLLDILDDDALKKQREEKVEALEAAEDLIDTIPFSLQPRKKQIKKEKQSDILDNNIVNPSKKPEIETVEELVDLPTVVETAAEDLKNETSAKINQQNNKLGTTTEQIYNVKMSKDQKADAVKNYFSSILKQGK